MVKKLKFDPDAKTEIRDAALYYENIRPGLGEAFVLEVEISVQNLFNDPWRWRCIRGPYRRCIVRRFPYYIIFVAEETEVYIVAVMHRKRRPEYWIPRTIDH